MNTVKPNTSNNSKEVVAKSIPELKTLLEKDKFISNVVKSDKFINDFNKIFKN